jgi:hypothetical protein
VETNAECEEDHSNNSKQCTSEITIGTEISIPTLCEIAVPAFFEQFGFWKKIKDANTNNVGYRGAANVGDYGAANAGNLGAANAGNLGAANAGNLGAANVGFRGAATVGDCGAANAGDRGAANAGNRGAATAGDRGAATAGDRGAATAGDRGAATAGDYGVASVGKNGVAIARTRGRVKGAIGAILVLIDRDDSGEIVDFACAPVDDIKIKADTFYTLKCGQFVSWE